MLAADDSSFPAEHALLKIEKLFCIKSGLQLGKQIAAAGASDTVLDGEIVFVDSSERQQLTDLLFHRGDPCFFDPKGQVRTGIEAGKNGISGS